MKLLAGVIAATAIFCQTTLAMAEDLRLLMFEQPGCQYCAQWNADVAPEYPLTDEGRAAPLERVQLRDPLAEGITLRSPPVFTPTFVLLRDGTEVGRIEGYPGEDFFWGLLGQLIAVAGKDGA
jgi:thioredoxin-related protein